MFTYRRTLISAFCILGALCVSISGQPWKIVHSGVEHAVVDHKLGGDPVKINLLRLDLRKVRLDVHHALDKTVGVETTSAIASRHRAVAAINAGFFRLDRSEYAGDPAGVLCIDGELLSESSNNRIALFVSNRARSTSVAFGFLSVKEHLTVGREEFLFPGLNRERKADEIIRYTPEFDRTTLTHGDGVEVVVRRGRVVQVNDRRGNTAIPTDGYVLSATGYVREQLLKVAQIGAAVHVRTVIGPMSGISSSETSRITTAFETADDIVAGVPQLIRNRRIDITWQAERAGRAFAESRHPRTAVAKLKDGKFLMMTVDGRQPGASVGMTLRELADYLLSAGATDAMNLDGGGSTTMFLDGKIVNTPSDKEGERKVSDAILVTLRKKM